MTKANTNNEDIPFWKYSGWLMMGFVAGICLHSPWPYAKIGITTLSIVAGVLTILIVIAKKTNDKKYIGVLCMVLLGLWRFEGAILPKDLRWLDPTHFAHQHAEPNLWRQSLTNRIQSGLPGDAGALLAGILYGDRVLSKDAKDSFRVSGMTHIIAVSGSNVMLLIMAIVSMLRWLRISRANIFFSLTVALIAFVWIVSPQAPVMRAAIMGWLIALAPLVGRLPSTNRLLLISACCFTAWKPTSLAYDPSFALSFLATIGLMTWGPWIDAKLEPWLSWKKTREIISMTIATTLLTTPYTAWAFGRMGVLTIFTNILAVPLVPWALGSGLIALLIPIAPLTWPAKGFLDAIVIIARFASSLGWGSWNVAISPLKALGCYIVLWLAWKKLSTIEREKIIHKTQTKTVTRDPMLERENSA